MTGVDLILAMGMALMLAAFDSAQLKPAEETGSHIPTKPEPLSANRGAAVEYGFAQCIFRNNPRAATALLLHSDQLSVDLRGAGIRNLNTAFGMDDCLGRQADGDDFMLGMRTNDRRTRVVLLEQAYLNSQRQPPKLSDADARYLPHTIVSTGEEMQTAQSLAAFSDCVVFSDVTKADALLRTMPGSAAERAAAAALAPVMGNCLRKGQQVSLNVRNIRAIVADGLWVRFARPVQVR